VKSESGSGSGSLLLAPLAFLSIPLFSVWDSYVLTILWRWFVVPFGMPVIGKAHAYGLCVLVGLVRARMRKDDDPGLAATIAFAVISPAIALFCGWIGHSLMGGG
jgi:hypothetical protein